MAGRSTAAARCIMPTRSASSTSPTGCRTTPGRPTILHSNRRHCSSASPPKARHLRHWRKQRKRLDEALPSPHVIPGCAARRRPGISRFRVRAPRAPGLCGVSMTHPGEKFYPEGVHWDDPIAQGTLPDLLSKAALQYVVRPAIEFRDCPISYAELEAMVEAAAAAFLRAGYGENSSVALFLGNSPDHPVNFFGALKAGARVVHLSPLDGEIALSHKLSYSGARVLVTSNLAALLPTALKFLAHGLLDR